MNYSNSRRIVKFNCFINVGPIGFEFNICHIPKCHCPKNLTNLSYLGLGQVF